MPAPSSAFGAAATRVARAVAMLFVFVTPVCHAIRHLPFIVAAARLLDADDALWRERGSRCRAARRHAAISLSMPAMRADADADAADAILMPCCCHAIDAYAMRHADVFPLLLFCRRAAECSAQRDVMQASDCSISDAVRLMRAMMRSGEARNAAPLARRQSGARGAAQQQTASAAEAAQLRGARRGRRQRAPGAAAARGTQAQRVAQRAARAAPLQTTRRRAASRRRRRDAAFIDFPFSPSSSSDFRLTPMPLDAIDYAID